MPTNQTELNWESTANGSLPSGQAEAVANAPGDSPSSIPDSRKERGVTPRVVVLALALAVMLGYVIPIVDFKLRNTYLGATHLPPGAVGVLLVLVLLVNPLLRVISKKFALSRNEALTVYITCLFSSLVPGHGAESIAIPNMIASFYYATRENAWLGMLQPYLKPWLTPALTGDGQYNRSLVEGWFIGTSGQAIPWGAWLVPLVLWGSFVLVSYAMLGCLSVMLRAQWAENEALAFPLLRLPLQMTEDLDRTDKYGSLGQFFRNPAMWCGFGIAVFIQMFRGLSLYFPDVPTFPLDLDSGPMLSEPPWNQIGWVAIVIYPIAVAIAYLLTSEISFSLWFFLWFINFQYIAAAGLGFPPDYLPSGTGIFSDTKLFTGYQMIGCYVAYVFIVLWTGREHFHHILQRALGRVSARKGEKGEMLSYPVAFWGFFSAFAYMVGFCCVAGVRLDVALALWITYLIFAIGLTRVAVEGGMLFLLHDSAPLGVIARLFNSGPSAWLTPASGLVPASFFQATMVVHMRGFIMPSFVHSFKLAHDHKIARRPLGALLVAVIVTSVVVSWHSAVRLGYDNGGLQLTNQFFKKNGSLWPINFIDGMGRPGTPVFQNWFWLGFGAILTFGMMLARSRFAAFPFHPIGYLMCVTFPAKMLWFSIFLGWLCKVVITRFGGVESYRKMIPAFLGLALGDVAMILFWLVIDGWQGRVGHQLMPY